IQNRLRGCIIQAFDGAHFIFQRKRPNVRANFGPLHLANDIGFIDRRQFEIRAPRSRTSSQAALAAIIQQDFSAMIWKMPLPFHGVQYRKESDPPSGALVHSQAARKGQTSAELFPDEASRGEAAKEVSFPLDVSCKFLFPRINPPLRWLLLRYQLDAAWRAAGPMIPPGHCNHAPLRLSRKN
ncbi:MAG: hypothetical protein ACRENG_27875, partial [bacterium]